MERKIIFLGIIMSIFFCLPTMANGDLSERIKELNTEIKNDSDNAELFLKRAVLYLQDNEPKLSIQDLKKCEQLGLNSVEVELTYAKNYRVLEKYKKGLAIVDAVLASDNEQVDALLLKAELLSDLTEFTKSAMYFENVIDKSDIKLPENYLAAALAWEKANNIGQSITILEKGINKLGELPVFYQKLKEIAISQKRFRKAIAYQTKIIEVADNKEKAYYQRALMYMENNDLDKAKEDLTMALKLVEMLPKDQQSSASTKELVQAVKRTMKFYDYN